jgi:hypothetical protein
MTKEKYTGCEEHCQECLYSDCLKPSETIKTDKEFNNYLFGKTETEKRRKINERRRTYKTKRAE